MLYVTRSVCFSEGMSSSNKRNRFFIIHRHPGKSVPYVSCSSQWIGLSTGSFRIYIDEPHLNGSQWVVNFLNLKLAVVVIKPCGFRTPVHIFLGFPYISPSSGKAKGLETHRFECNVTCQDHQVGP